jgi:hypothetical protein
VEAWRAALRIGFIPQWSLEQLIVLKEALLKDDPALTQGSTTTPPPLMSVQEWPVEACCPITYPGWKGLGLVTVGDCEAFFAESCHRADELLGEMGACKWYINYLDETARDEMRRELIREIDRAIEERASEQSETTPDSIPALDPFAPEVFT